MAYRVLFLLASFASWALGQQPQSINLSADKPVAHTLLAGQSAVFFLANAQLQTSFFTTSTASLDAAGNATSSLESGLTRRQQSDPASGTASKPSALANPLNVAVWSCLLPPPASGASQTPPALQVSVSTNGGSTFGPVIRDVSQRVAEIGLRAPPPPSTGISFVKPYGASFVSASIDDFEDAGGLYIRVTAPPSGSQWPFEIVVSKALLDFSKEGSVSGVTPLDSDATNMAFKPSENAVQILGEPQLFMAPTRADSFMPYSRCAMQPLGARLVTLSDASFSAIGSGSGSPLDGGWLARGLAPSTAYALYAFPVGGIPYSFQPAVLATKRSASPCQLVHSLDFCDSVAYAVPSNPSFSGNAAGLGVFYDEIARGVFANFSASIDQFDCRIPYSLVRNCDDCKLAYKHWLCSVILPRCTDIPDGVADTLSIFTHHTDALDSNLLVRPAGKALRATGLIDSELKPAAYAEVLPCDNVCYEVVQSCPSYLGFQCPRDLGTRAYNYGVVSRGAVGPDDSRDPNTGAPVRQMDKEPRVQCSGYKSEFQRLFDKNGDPILPGSAASQLGTTATFFVPVLLLLSLAV